MGKSAGSVMTKRIWTCLTTVLAGSFLSFSSYAAEFRVLYAEPVVLPSIDVAAGSSKSTATRRMSFRAFERQFSLVLEDNDRLLNRLDAGALMQVSNLKLLRGTLDGVPGSWVRLTLNAEDGQYSGAIWDGSELYAIEPR